MINPFKQIWWWLDDRTDFIEPLRAIGRFRVPPGVGWAYVFGSATLVAFLIELVTGVALATTYVPSAGGAYNSLQVITHLAPFGRVLRGMHYFGASALVVLLAIHALRVYVTAAYKFPREVNWLSGVVLLLLTVAIAFTGQLLRWDQNAVWSVVITAGHVGNMPLVGGVLENLLLAGNDVSGATLGRFFALHVLVLPALILLFIGAHLWSIARIGVSEPLREIAPIEAAIYRPWYAQLLKNYGQPLWPNVVWRDLLFGTAVTLLIVALASIFGPPELGKMPDPRVIQSYPHPDWYFLWYLALLASLPSGLQNGAIVLLPLLFVILLIALPFLGKRGERRLRRRPWAIAFTFLAVTLMLTFWQIGEAAPWATNLEAPPLPVTVIGAASGPLYEGAQLFNQRGCENCHQISGYGGNRGPDLTSVGTRRTAAQITARILGGGNGMPIYGRILKPGEVDLLLAFLQSRKER